MKHLSPKTTQEDKMLTNVTVIVAVGSVALSIILALLFLTRTPYPAGSSSTIDPAVFGQLGDVIGGLAGTAIGILTVFLILKTYQSQKVELIATQQALYDQRTEATVISMLATLRAIITEAGGTVTVSVPIHSDTLGITTLTGRDYIHNVILDLRRRIKYGDFNRQLQFDPITCLFRPYYQNLASLTDDGKKIISGRRKASFVR